VLITLLTGFIAGIISNFLILYWFEKEIPMFFQIEKINKNTDNTSFYISILLTAATYLLLSLLLHWYAVGFSTDFSTVVEKIGRVEVFFEVFLLSFLFLGGRSLLYGKIVLNLNNVDLKVGSYD